MGGRRCNSGGLLYEPDPPLPCHRWHFYSPQDLVRRFVRGGQGDRWGRACRWSRLCQRGRRGRGDPRREPRSRGQVVARPQGREGAGELSASEAGDPGRVQGRRCLLFLSPPRTPRAGLTLGPEGPAGPAAPWSPEGP